MAIKAFPREKFDENREFAVLRKFTFNGQALVPGDPFDKTTASTRKLRLLYDQRYLSFAGGDDKAPEIPQTEPESPAQQPVGEPPETEQAPLRSGPRRRLLHQA